MKAITTNLLEAALVEREEYLEDLQSIEKGVQQQISNLQYEIDALLIRIYNSYKDEGNK